MSSCSQLDIDSTGGCTAESVGCGVAIAKPPCGQTVDPVTFGNPCSSALGNGLGHRHSGSVLVLYIVAPRDLLPPFGTGCGGQRGIDPVEQLTSTIGIVVLDTLVNGVADAGRHRTICNRTRAKALGGVWLADQALFTRQIWRGHQSAFEAKAADIFGLRQIAAFGQPRLNGGQFHARTVGVKVILSLRYNVQRAVGALGQHVFDIAPAFCIDGAEQISVILLV